MHLNIDEMQKGFANYWKQYMQDTPMGMQDATCYESRISFPTDVKLLWECCHAIYQMIQEQRKSLRLRKSRMNYHKQKHHFQSYQKTRKKTRRAEKKLRRKLLKFLVKLLQHLEGLHDFKLSGKQKTKLNTSKKYMINSMTSCMVISQSRTA
jgi:IS5 family transposase